MSADHDDFLRKSNHLDMLDRALMSGRIDRRQFILLGIAAGLSAASATNLAAQSSSIRDNQIARARSLENHYDYIVCGAGTSGCVVAGRLAADPKVKVLLLEAGGTDDAPSLLNPSIWFTNIGSATDWSYKSEPATALNQRSIIMPMGHALGGGSSINAMVYARGHKSDFDEWARASGDEAWGYDHVMSIYRRIENWQGKPDPARRGMGGPVWVDQLQNPSPVALSMLKAAAGIGIPTFYDMNGAMMEGEGGCALPNVIIKDGRRHNMVSAYLRPVLSQSNITVLTGAFVNRLTMRGDRADGVEFRWQGKVQHVKATKVVLSLGAINTPKLLMLSGIGDESALKKVGISAEHHLPGVGQNYQDHPIVEGCLWEYKAPMAPRNNAAECTLFWKSNSQLATPDLQPFLLEVPVAGEKMHELFRIPTSGFTIAPGLVRPKSHGYIAIRSADPNDAPIVQPNLLQHQDDVDALVRGAELCREIGNSTEMRELVKREIAPGPMSRNELATLMRNAAESYGHSTCSCRMGTDEGAVVDSRLAVRGLSGLHIADGSIMPRITTGNTMAPCIIIGERLAEILMA